MGCLLGSTPLCLCGILLGVRLQCVELSCSWSHCLPALALGFSLDYTDDSVERLITLRESMDNPDHSVLYKTCSELAKVRNSVTG